MNSRLARLGVIVIGLGVAGTVQAGAFDTAELRGEGAGSAGSGPADQRNKRQRTNFGPRFYAELGLSTADAGFSAKDTASSPSVSDFDSFTGFTPVVGYRFYRSKGVAVSAEAFYNYFDETDARHGTTAVTDIDAQYQNLGVGIKAEMNLFPRISTYIKIGAHRWDADYKAVVSESGSAVSESYDRSSTDMFLGLGVAYKISKHFYAAVNYVDYKVDYIDSIELQKDESITVLGAQVGYRF